MNFNIFGVVRKMYIFFWGGGYEDFVDIFLGSSQNWTSLGSFLCILGSFLKVEIHNTCRTCPTINAEFAPDGLYLNFI